jgi:hypothetical protein
MPYIGYAPLLTRSELIELGYDRALIDELTPGDDLLSTDPARIARQARLNQLTVQDSLKTDSEDHSTDRFRYYVNYLRIDEDEDGLQSFVYLQGRKYDPLRQAYGPHSAVSLDAEVDAP